jgi:hypothetical protein
MAKVSLNPCFERDEDWEGACAAFRFEKTADVKSSPVKSWTDPFPGVFVENFVSDPGFVAELEEHLLQLLGMREQRFEERNNDLFQFRQTPALIPYEEVGTNGEASGSTGDPVSVFGRLLKEVVRPRLQAVSGIELDDKIFISSSIYEHTGNSTPYIGFIAFGHRL